MADGETFSPVEATGASSGAGGFYPWFVVGLLTLVSVVGYIDRQLINILVEPIKHSFAINDTRLSLLQGLAFMSAYTLLAPVFGRLVDLYNRRTILTVEVGCWSLFTALCGMSKTYLQIFGARLGTGAMEAGLFPCSWSLIGDTMPVRQVARAFSIYLMAPYIGGGLALFLGATLLDMSSNGLMLGMEPWRAIFLLVGAPGIVLALLVFLTVREPARRRGATVDAPAAEAAVPEPNAPASGVGEALRLFVRRRDFYFNFYVGMAGIVLSIYAIPAWGPALLARTFQVQTGVIGREFGLLTILSGSVGVLSGPFLSSWMRRRGVRQSIIGVAVASAIGLAGCALLLAFAGSYATALTAIGIAGFFCSLPQAMAATAIQIATPASQRGLASSLYIVTMTVIGLGIGPTAVALITDYGFADPAGVRWSLPIVSGIAALCGVPLLIRAARSGAIVEEERQ